MALTDSYLNDLFFTLGCFWGIWASLNADCEQSEKYDQVKTQEVSEESLAVVLVIR